MYAIQTKGTNPVHLGVFHSAKHAETSMRMNQISGEVVKLPPYHLATFTIGHEFSVFSLNGLCKATVRKEACNA